MAASAQTPPLDETRTRRTILWAEFVVVMLLAFVAPAMSQFVDMITSISSYSKVYFALHDLFRIGLILFLVWVVDGSLKGIGISRPRWKQDLVASLLVFLVFVAAIVILPVLFPRSHDVTKIDPLRSYSEADYSLSSTLLAAIVAAVLQEVLQRGYALSRLNELLGSKWAATGVAALAFGIVDANYHFHDILWTVALYAAMGVAFFKTGRLWAGLLVAIIMHVYGAYFLYGAAHR